MKEKRDRVREQQELTLTPNIDRLVIEGEGVDCTEVKGAMT